MLADRAGGGGGRCGSVALRAVPVGEVQTELVRQGAFLRVGGGGRRVDVDERLVGVSIRRG